MSHDGTHEDQLRQLRDRDVRRALAGYSEQVAGEMVAATAGETFVKLARPPDKNCARCYGRGMIGRNAETRKFIACRCTL